MTRARTLVSTLGLLLVGGQALASDGWRLGGGLLIGAPHPLNLSFDARPSTQSVWSFALTGGGLSVPLNGGITVGISNFDLRGRWHPFSGSFFLGAIFGTQTISGKGSTSVDLAGVGTIPMSAKVDIRSTYLTPHLGWLWMFGSGFTLGFELGWQFPFGASSTLDVTVTDPNLSPYLDTAKASAPYQKLQSDLEDSANKVGTISFPYVTALRLGWMF